MDELRTNTQPSDQSAVNRSDSIIDKRVSFSKNTYQKINIIKTLMDDMLQNLQEKEALGFILDKAVDYYYKSDEIQKKLLGL